MALIATIGASDSNSYVDQLFASEYFNSRIGSDEWMSAISSVRDSALMMATDILDTNFEWIGDISSDTQSLRWPRKNAIDVDGRDVPENVVPIQIKRASCELAISIIANVGYVAEVNDLDSVKVGPISVNFDQVVSKYPIPKKVLDILSHYGDYQGSVGGRTITTTSVIRT
jgi:hypothetical protein